MTKDGYAYCVGMRYFRTVLRLLVVLHGTTRWRVHIILIVVLLSAVSAQEA